MHKDETQNIPITLGDGAAADNKQADYRGKINITAGKVLTINANLWVTVQAFLTWFNVNVTPIFALFAWLGFAVFGFYTAIDGIHYVNNTNRLLISIVVIGAFASLAFTRKSK